MQVDLDPDGAVVTVVSGPPVPILQDGKVIELAVGTVHRVPKAEFAASAPPDQPPSGEGEEGATTADARSA